MTYEILQLLLIGLGLALTPVLFRRFPKLPAAKQPRELQARELEKGLSQTGEAATQQLQLHPYPSGSRISVIIPARNEAMNLPLLLQDLKEQSTNPLEIICVDDASTDATAQIAAGYGIKIITLHDKPAGWTGKTWACQQGAEHAAGELLLFLDADVRMAPDGIARILQAYEKEAVTLSVQPYHETFRPYEQFSLIFNLIQGAANGTTTGQDKALGLHGPVILMPRTVYELIGGHESVRRHVIEDLALGQRLREAGQPFRVYVGDESIRYRMYADGPVSLFQGWVKNMAAGAALMPFVLFLRVFFWVTVMAAVPIHLVRHAVQGNLALTLAYIGLYISWIVIIWALAAKLGRFRRGAIVFYPIVLAATTLIFLVSAVKKLFRISVTWKGRSIPGRVEL